MLTLRQAEVNRILGKVDELAESEEEMTIPYVVGESVKVVDGPFNETNCEVNEVLLCQRRPYLVHLDHY